MGKSEGPPSRYVVLDLNGAEPLRPPPYRHAAPRHHSHSSGGDDFCCCGSFCWCCCCCYCLLIFLMVATAVVAFVYLNPKPPSYAVSNLSITSFNISSDLSLHTGLNITVRTENPNDKIGITYNQDSSVRLVYRDTNLCAGKLPSFYQGYHNVTEMSIVMEGHSKLGPDMQEDLREDKEKGQIPIDVYVTIPIQLRILDRDTKPIAVTVRCELVIDNIDPHERITVKSAKYYVVW